MAVNEPDVGSERNSVFSQPYNTTEFYIGLSLAISSTVFIGKLLYFLDLITVCVAIS
jgi:hypothetical protein